MTRSRALQDQCTEVDRCAAFACGWLLDVKVVDKLVEAFDPNVQLISTGLDLIDPKRSVRLQLDCMPDAATGCRYSLPSSVRRQRLSHSRRSGSDRPVDRALRGFNAK